MSWPRMMNLLFTRRRQPRIRFVRATGAEILLTNKTPLNAATLNALPELRLICVLATGVNTVDLVAAKNNGVIVCNVPEYGTDSVAQFVMAQVLYHAHRVGLHDARIRDGAWAKYDAFSFWGNASSRTGWASVWNTWIWTNRESCRQAGPGLWYEGARAQPQPHRRASIGEIVHI